MQPLPLPSVGHSDTQGLGAEEEDLPSLLLKKTANEDLVCSSPQTYP